MKLTGQQYKQLLDALVSAYPTRNTLAQMIFFELGENLDTIVGSGSLVDTTFDLIKWAEARGRLDDLIRGAARTNSGNSDLKAFIKDVGDAQASSAISPSPTSAQDSTTSASPATPATPATPRSFVEIKRQALQDRRAALVEDYQAANQQIVQTLADLDRQRLLRQLEALERNIAQIDDDLSKLG